MKTLPLTILFVVMSVNVADATPNAEVLAPIHQFMDSFNKGDIKGAEAAHVAENLIIIDEFPPFMWQGANTFKAWLDDLTKHDTAAGVTDGNMRLGDVIREELGDGTAYVVMAAVYSFKVRGIPMREAAQMTFALRKEAAGWRINGWTFAGAKPTSQTPT